MYYHHYHWLGLPWLIVLVIAVVPFWRICKRVGHSPWLSLLVVLPLVNLIFIYYLAFSLWPVEHRGASGGAPGVPPA
jgi:hypothetical protein